MTTTPILVFLVEDEDTIRFVLEDALTDGGFAVALATSGEQAMAMLNKEGANYCALITDVNLPGEVTGWEVARRAREINVQLPVIYMTGDRSHDWASKGVPHSRLLSKPFAIAQVVAAVAQLIDANPSSE